MLDLIANNIKEVFLPSFAKEDPEMLKGMVNDLNSDLDERHVEYADVLSELSDKLSKIEKAIDKGEDRDALMKAKNRVERKIEVYEEEHFDAISDITNKISKAEARLDFISKSEIDQDPFSSFNCDGENAFAGKNVTPENVSKFIKSLDPDYLRQTYGEDKLASINILAEDEYNETVTTIAKAKKSVGLDDILDQIEDAIKRVGKFKPIKNDEATVYVSSDDLDNLTKAQKQRLLETSIAKDAQSFSERDMKVGDKTSVRWVGALTNRKYQSSDMLIKAIKKDSVVMEFDEPFLTGNENKYAYRRGETVEIPRTHNKTWNLDNSFDIQ